MKEPEITDDFEDLNVDFDVDFDISDFDVVDFDEDFEQTRYTKPKLRRPTKQQNVKYNNAVKLARDMTVTENMRANAIIDGSFIFGDFIEAFIVENNILVPKMTISTLSYSQENVDSLKNLIAGGYVQELNLIVSHYFFSNERQKLIPYTYEQLDVDNKFQLAVAGTHCKSCIFTTAGGKKIVIHGSANLRSSQNIEQFTIEENKELFDFYDKYQNKILEEYKTINKALRVKKLWNLIK